MGRLLKKKRTLHCEICGGLLRTYRPHRKGCKYEKCKEWNALMKAMV